MTADAGLWCPGCQQHRIDDRHGAHCPVCTDRQAKDAEAAAVVLWHTGGRA